MLRRCVFVDRTREESGLGRALPVLCLFPATLMANMKTRNALSLVAYDYPTS